MRKLLRGLVCQSADPESGLCLRRVAGTVGFCVCIVALFHPGIDSQNFKELLYCSAALMCSVTFDGLINKKALNLKCAHPFQVRVNNRR